MGQLTSSTGFSIAAWVIHVDGHEGAASHRFSGSLPATAAAAAAAFPLLCALSQTPQFCGTGLIFFFFLFLYEGLEVGTRVHSAAHHRKRAPSHLTSEGLLITAKRHRLQTCCVQGRRSRLPSFVVFKYCQSTAVWERRKHRAPPERPGVDCSFGKILPLSRGFK